MAKVERSTVWYVENTKYSPDIRIELRPDRKRIVLHHGNQAVWIDVADVKIVTETMNVAVAEARLNHVVEDDEA